MSVSDAEANANLNSIVNAGGSYWVGLSLTVPDDALSPASIEDSGLPLVQLPRNGATTWEAAADRTVQPLAALDLGVATVDLVPAARVFYADSAGTTPLRSARVTDMTVAAGSHVIIPPEALAISVPAKKY